MSTVSISELAQEYTELKRELREAGSELYKAILSAKGLTHQSLCKIVFRDGRVECGAIKGYTVTKDGDYCLHLYQDMGGTVAYGVKPIHIRVGTLSNVDWAGISSITPYVLAEKSKVSTAN